MPKHASSRWKRLRRSLIANPERFAGGSAVSDLLGLLAVERECLYAAEPSIAGTGETSLGAAGSGVSHGTPAGELVHRWPARARIYPIPDVSGGQTAALGSLDRRPGHPPGHSPGASICAERESSRRWR